MRGEQEKGKGDGVMKDCLSSFYKDIVTSVFHGCDEKVPVPRHDMTKEVCCSYNCLWY